MSNISPRHADQVELPTHPKYTKTTVSKLSQPTQTSWYHDTVELYTFMRFGKKSPKTRWHLVTLDLARAIVAQDGRYK